LIIEEFCCNGNLRDYLLACRQTSYINEICNRSITYYLSTDEKDKIITPQEINGYVVPYTVSTINNNSMGKVNHSPNQDENRMNISTQDLICWSFQIACGMNHVANKKVILINFSR